MLDSLRLARGSFLLLPASLRIHKGLLLQGGLHLFARLDEVKLILAVSMDGSEDSTVPPKASAQKKPFRQ